MAVSDFEPFVALARETADMLIYGDRDGADGNLELIANIIEGLEIPEERCEMLARYATCPAKILPLWLQTTAFLCRLVKMRVEPDDELVPRLVALAWSLGEEGPQRDKMALMDTLKLLERYSRFNTCTVVSAFEIALREEYKRSVKAKANAKLGKAMNPDAPDEKAPNRPSDGAFKPGDHLRVRRLLRGCFPYYHHGIYVGDDHVVQFGGQIADKPSASIGVVSLGEFEKDGNAEVQTHGHYDQLGLWRPQADSAKKTVERAMLLADRPSRPYNLIGYNCEHVANWCVTGYAESHQVRNGFLASAGVNAAALLTLAKRDVPPSKSAVLGGLVFNAVALRTIYIYNREVRRFWGDMRTV